MSLEETSAVGAEQADLQLRRWLRGIFDAIISIIVGLTRISQTRNKMDKYVISLALRESHLLSLRLSITRSGSRLVVMAVLAFLILVGCENMVGVDSLSENSLTPASSEIPSMPQVKDGMLYFESRTDFEAVADYLIDRQDDDGLNEFEAKLNPFRSLRTEFDELIDQFQYSHGASLEIDRIVEDPVFETLLDQDGMIHVADTIYQVTRDYVYSTHIDNALIPGKQIRLRSRGALENQVTLSSTAPLVKFKIDRVADAPANPGKNMDVMGRGECWVFFDTPGSKYRYRMKGSIWINNWGIWRSVGTELESQKIKRKGFRRWRHHSVDEIALSGDLVTRKEEERRKTTSFSWEKENAAEIRKTLIKDREQVFIEVEVSANHSMYHTFDDDGVLSGSCDGFRSWSESDT